MSDKVYKDDYGREEKCFNCKESFILSHIDPYEPLEVYMCSCGKRRLKEIGDYEG